MAIRTLRLKLAKVLKLKASKAEVGEMRLWLVLPDTSLSEIRPERETDDLAWWGVEDGSEIVVSVSSAS
ncbi:hypothetical protein EUX98_g3447 [Antrodiella citrinella]|uniref:Ubiquitin-like domain-containing protein n=1 Tax=Antrodiella citrinella TaxID=2447956 RepID=A0A4S4N4N4_9APHY|nr:hypothetical protein EUX98_g3447 [Antrodiella citrinella]